MDCGLIGLIKTTYPISFITMVLASFGGLLAFIPRWIHIKSLQRQKGLRSTK